MNTQDILNVVLILALVAVTTCIVFVTIFFIRTLKAISLLADNLEDVTQNIKNKVQMKFLAAIPALLVALAGRVIKRKRG